MIQETYDVHYRERQKENPGGLNEERDNNYPDDKRNYEWECVHATRGHATRYGQMRGVAAPITRFAHRARHNATDRPTDQPTFVGPRSQLCLLRHLQGHMSD